MNLQGYCDYTACRKFNGRYISGTMTPHIVPDVAITCRNMKYAEHVRPRTVTRTDTIADGYFSSSSGTIANFTITAFYEWKLDQETEAEARASAVEYFNSLLAKLKKPALTHFPEGSNWTAASYTSYGTGSLTITEFNAEVNGQKLETKFNPEPTSINPQGFFSGFAKLPRFDLKQTITDSDLQQHDEIFYADLLNNPFTMPAKLEMAYTVTGSDSPIASNSDYIFSGPVSITVPWIKGQPFSDASIWLNKMYVFTK